MGLLLSKETDQAIGAAATAVRSFAARAERSLDGLDQTVAALGTGAVQLRDVLAVVHAELLALRALRVDLPLTIARAIADALEARHGSDPRP